MEGLLGALIFWPISIPYFLLEGTMICIDNMLGTTLSCYKYNTPEAAKQRYELAKKSIQKQQEMQEQKRLVIDKLHYENDPTGRCSECFKKTHVYVDVNGTYTCENCSSQDSITN